MPIQIKPTGVKTVDLSLFSDQAEQVIADRLAQVNNGTLTLGDLQKAHDAALAAKDGDADILANMLQAAKSGKPSSAFANQATLRVAQNQLAVDSDPKAKQFKATLDQYVIGQDFAKAALVRFMMSRDAKLDNAPLSLGIAGPPGVGKTELVRALAAAFHADPEKHIFVDCSQIQSGADMNSIIGAPPGYVGFQKKGDADGAADLSQAGVQAKFGDKKPIVILLDEVDKIGINDPTGNVKKEFWTVFGRCLQDGKLTLRNGEVVDLSDAIFVMTGNAGADTAGGLPKGDAQRRHYIAAMKKELPDYIVSRVPNITAADELDPVQTKAITELSLNSKFKVACHKAKREHGKDIGFKVAGQVSAFFGRIGLSKQYGARPLKNILRQLLDPVIAGTIKSAGDEERYELRLKAGVTDVELTKIADAFAAKAPAIPEEYDSTNFPVELVLTNPKPKFYPYAGVIPHSDTGTPFVVASGSVSGRGYLAVNKGDKGSKNELYFVRAGATEAADQFQPVALPPKLADANFTMTAVTLDKSRVYLSAMNLPAQGGKAETCGFVYDADKKSFTDVGPLPEPLVGAAMGAVAGDIIAVGGRLALHDGQNWSVSTDPLDMNGNPLHDLAYRFNGATLKWEVLKNAPKVTRAFSTALEHEGKLWFFGGEEVYTTPQGVRVSRSSSEVDVYDPKTGKFTAGPALPTGVAFATAFNDGFGRIQLLGGASYIDFGRQLSVRSTILRLDPALDDPKWKSSDTLPAPAAQLAVVPHAAGVVVGPFVRDDQTQGFEILR
ncbi:MAG: AAA family ATPase [Deltaproteobacteria bacterium]|nr:AAA family ATPase [Deltaproteobacteria bacterium]